MGPDYSPPGGESWDAFYERAGRAWRRVEEAAAETAGALAIVTHGLVCHSFALHHLLLEPPLVNPERWGNTAVTEIDRPRPGACASSTARGISMACRTWSTTSRRRRGLELAPRDDRGRRMRNVEMSSGFDRIAFDQIDVVLLDAGGTLVSLDFEWVERELAARGIECRAQELERAEAAARPAVSREAGERLAQGREPLGFEAFLAIWLRRLAPFADSPAEVRSFARIARTGPSAGR